MLAPNALLTTRLAQQQLTAPSFTGAGQVVQWLCAVQSQDYAGGIWAIALRARGLTEQDVNRAFDAGEILRTHVMRPTWHFVAPADLRWLLMLTAPRVHAIGASYLRKAELTPGLLARCHRVFEKSLAGGTALTRNELGAALGRAGIEATAARLGLIAMNAELDGLICSGPRRGKQFTYALLEERVPPSATRSREEALAEIATRYFTSHGPATLHDMTWWSGLALRDVREGVALAGTSLAHITVGDLTYWFDASLSGTSGRPSGTYLLPNYDEFLIAYRDRGLSVLPRADGVVDNPIFAHQVVADGRVVGSWQRTIAPRRAAIDVLMYDGAPSPRMQRRLQGAADAYAAFIERPVALSVR